LLIKGEPAEIRLADWRKVMNGYGLYWGDFLAIGILFSVIGILLVALVWDYVDIKIADRRSANMEQHWATTIREER
jgi:hypothetical protein